MTPTKPIINAILIIASLISLPLPSLAELDKPNNANSDPIGIRFVLANPPLPDNGTPQTNRGTGTRGDCIYKAESPPLTHLAGEKNFELTVSEHPTFWVYVPYTSAEVPSGEFSLQDGDEDVYRTRFQLPAKAGVVGISLPSTNKSLEVGKTYRWYFEINCPSSDSTNQKTPDSVTGIVKRVSPSIQLAEELKTAKTPLERIAAYTKHSIWYETLTELAQLRLKEPENPTINKLWVDLLTDENIGLNSIAPQPIAGSVTTNSPPK
ncbi:DUF928 domain-containing protein [Limnofasciculus baicalensis]|uniref:DUF928 domain-containing protein n=1 Tax=Limnofasciculus baicalensis BBK-W-15 TaxID=2699891 RepID=A0AAE3GRN1_9CYAN|nr:DUF928 domain-containing protein [Limnofasciculus baicalensis]MCP2729431.1 DUF928 domain-containing protein [Limnofasciculus baicalensis BBK-W-15]